MEHVPEELIDPGTLADVADARAEGIFGEDMAEHGAMAANRGDLETARRSIASAIDNTDDLRLLFLGFQFFFRNGEIDLAERLVRRRLSLAESRGQREHLARACTNLGLILQKRGLRDESKREHERSLAIAEQLGNPEGIARALGNLANVYEEAKDLVMAESLNRRALAIARQHALRRIEANTSANLGDIAATQGHSAEAVRHWTSALQIWSSIGISKHIAEYEAKVAAHNL